MAAGYLANGVCHTSLPVALYDLMGSLYPRSINTGSVLVTAGNGNSASSNAGFEFVTAQSISTSGLITYSTRDNSTLSVLMSNKSIQLMSCDTSFVDAQLPNTFNYAYAGGLWALSFTFVVGLYFVTKGYGTILNFIKGH